MPLQISLPGKLLVAAIHLAGPNPWRGWLFLIYGLLLAGSGLLPAIWLGRRGLLVGGGGSTETELLTSSVLFVLTIVLERNTALLQPYPELKRNAQQHDGRRARRWKVGSI